MMQIVGIGRGINPTSNTAISPITIFGSNLRSWYQAWDAGARTLDTSGTTTYSAVQNKAPGFTGESLTHGTKAQQPVYSAANINGRDALTINSNAQRMGLSLSANITGTVFAYIVMRTAAAWASNKQFLNINSGATPWWNSGGAGCSFLTTAFATDKIGGAVGGGYNDAITITTSTVSCFYTQITNGTGSAVGINNGSLTSQTNTAALNSDTMTIGQHTLGGTTDSLSGDYAEWGVILGAPTAQQRTDLYNYLKGLYGLP